MIPDLIAGLHPLWSGTICIPREVCHQALPGYIAVHRSVNCRVHMFVTILDTVSSLFAYL